MLPPKWSIERNKRLFKQILIPEIQRLLALEDLSKEESLLAGTIQAARNDFERDPEVIARLQIATAIGGTHSVSMSIEHVLFDLVCNPDVLEEVTDEIRSKSAEIGGVWDHFAYDSLPKVDSILKESARLRPPTMTVYNRIMQTDYTLSNGVTLRKGEQICVSGCSIQKDPNIYPDVFTKYGGLRSYAQGQRDSKPHPYKSSDEDLIWGAGRWACPGRFLANIEAKIIIVKLLSEYEFKLLPGKGRPKDMTFHEYNFVGEHEKIMVRRRENDLWVGS
jgi:cytochrome P450